jgi:hypothetical protein
LRFRWAHLAAPAIIAAACLITACGGADDSSQGGQTGTGPDGTLSPATTATPQPSALDQALAGIKDDGSWNKDTALAVFAAAIGPLPGVETATPDDSWHSGSLAIRMVQAYWDDLTEEQRQAVRGYLGEGASAILPVAYRRGPSQLETYQEMLDGIAADIGSHFGRPLGIPIRIQFPAQDDTNMDWAWAAGNWGEVPAGSPATACIVNIPPSTANDSSRGPYLRWLFLHEIWHCFEYTMIDNETLLSSPAWVIEGSASWVAEAITSGSGHPPPENEHWGHYVNDPGKRLFARSYDAVGFYGQLAHNNINPWSVIEAMVKAGNSDAALQASGAAAATFTDRWGSSWFRDSRPNNDWAMTNGYGIPPAGVHAPPQPIDIADGGEGAISAPPNAGAIADVHTAAFVTHFDAHGAGRIADEGGQVDDIVRDSTLDLCTTPSGDCKCPEGSPNTQQTPKTAPSRLRAAVTGEPHGSSTMGMRGISKEEWCGRTPTPTPSSSPAPATFDGDCGQFLPSDEVSAAVGVDIGTPTSVPTALTFACVWEDTRWSLQGQSKSIPIPPTELTFAGLPCQRRGLYDENTAYCLNSVTVEGVTGSGGLVWTSKWGFTLSTGTISLEEAQNKIVPILARTGN